MRAIGIVGRSGSGKTTLIEALLPRLRARSLRVSTIKRTHHAVDLDPPGKDSRRHREAGAEEVILASTHRWALMRETQQPESLAGLLARLAPVDLVLVEGFGGGREHGILARLEVVRAEIAGLADKRPLFHHEAGIDAIAADAPVAGWSGALLALDDPASICDWIVSVAL